MKPRWMQSSGSLSVAISGVSRSFAAYSPQPMRGTPPGEWVLCLETAEHIPREHEATLLRNLHQLNTLGIVLSWSNNAGGNGHVNLRTNEWVAKRFARMGYEHDLNAERALRTAVRDIHWFRDTIMVFRRANQR